VATDAAPAQLEALQDAVGADLVVGSWLVGDASTPGRLRSQGFGRHTFLCGQSGSGKTYALGVLLEQLVLGTGLRMVVLDPNSDFVHLDRTRPGVPAEVADRLHAAGVRVLGADGSGHERLRLRYTALPRAARAALLRLDPLVDRDEYNVFLRASADQPPDTVGGFVRRLSEGSAAEQALARRIENLGLDRWQAWAGGDASLPEVVADGGRVTVADLSGFHDSTEPLAVALGLVEDLWARRADRTPTLLVLDEAHNLCPAEPRGTVQTALVDRLVDIAAEGRKYGLWLLLSTQRPSKIHPQVLSQCDNLALMRMNSPADVAALASVFGFAPPDMLARAPSFVQGEALFAGVFAPVPSFVRMGERLTPEGGSDVRVPGPTA
jgi:DNA helicase HerA-like ATPase